MIFQTKAMKLKASKNDFFYKSYLTINEKDIANNMTLWKNQS